MAQLENKFYFSSIDFRGFPYVTFRERKEKSFFVKEVEKNFNKSTSTWIPFERKTKSTKKLEQKKINLL